MIKERNELPTNISLIIMIIFSITIACVLANKFPAHIEQNQIKEYLKK